MADGGDGGAMPEAAEDLMQMDEGQQASMGDDVGECGGAV